MGHFSGIMLLRLLKMRYMRVQLNGRALAFQASHMGSIPITRSIFSRVLLQHSNMRQQLSWIEHRPSKARVRGSNPFWRTNNYGGYSSVGQNARLWLQRSWVQVPLFTPFILIPHLLVGVQPSGKASDFDSDIRRFKSCHPSQYLYGPLAQSVEHMTFNHGVPRSSRGWVTIR